MKLSALKIVIIMFNPSPMLITCLINHYFYICIHYNDKKVSSFPCRLTQSKLGKSAAVQIVIV